MLKFIIIIVSKLRCASLLWFVWFDASSVRLEQCMSEIMQTVTDMPGGAGDYATPMEAVEMMEENRLLEQSACDDPDLDDVTRLLRHVVNCSASSSCIRQASHYTIFVVRCIRSDTIWSNGLSQRTVSFDWNRDSCDPPSHTTQLISLRLCFPAIRHNSLTLHDVVTMSASWEPSQGIAS